MSFLSTRLQLCITSGEMVPSFKSYSKLQEFLSFKEAFIRVKHSHTYFEQETFLDWELLQVVLLTQPKSLDNTVPGIVCINSD